MANKKITYENKVTQYESQLNNQQKITSGDMNEIKTVVNNHADSLDTQEIQLDTINTKINSGELAGTSIYIQNENDNNYTFYKNLSMTKDEVTDPSKIIQRDFVDEDGNVYIENLDISMIIFLLTVILEILLIKEEQIQYYYQILKRYILLIDGGLLIVMLV